MNRRSAERLKLFGRLAERLKVSATLKELSFKPFLVWYRGSGLLEISL